MNLAENILDFHHYSLKVTDFRSTLKFYKALGFHEIHSWELPSFNLKKGMMLYNEKINCYIELFDKDAEIPTQGRKRNADEEFVENSILHICFTVENAEKAREEALKIGAKNLSDGVFEISLANDEKSVEVRNSLVYSPNGEVIEFLEKVSF
ncbi:VOC family protein [Chryseobacterium turcicum]|uniref:VOC family protein n=1 Tax=Chryseobacterium turcicum TaxID=2898076 RepID=A0A9Q3YV30_9FLAO|nr:VOC family protein [Chryseobacterium turcicum]MCD1116413.1 VOC family protein [Chryseobacterium turcicum]